MQVRLFCIITVNIRAPTFDKQNCYKSWQYGKLYTNCIAMHPYRGRTEYTNNTLYQLALSLLL